MGFLQIGVLESVCKGAGIPSFRDVATLFSQKLNVIQRLVYGAHPAGCYALYTLL